MCVRVYKSVCTLISSLWYKILSLDCFPVPVCVYRSVLFFCQACFRCVCCLDVNGLIVFSCFLSGCLITKRRRAPVRIWRSCCLTARTFTLIINWLTSTSSWTWPTCCCRTPRPTASWRTVWAPDPDTAAPRALTV